MVYLQIGKDKRYISMFIALIICIIYILGMSYYDRKPDEISKLYKGAAIEGIQYEQIQINNTGRKESINFIGCIEGEIAKEKRAYYKNQILKSLNGHVVDYYQDDYNNTTESYYGYTPIIDTYITTTGRRRMNTQIIFTYNEVTNMTRVIVAFPFYNDPY